MQYQLIMHKNPTTWEALHNDTRNRVMIGHGDFISRIRESGEMVAIYALQNPSQSVVVHTAGGEVRVEAKPFQTGDWFLGGFYIVECESDERAHDLAAMIPDAAVEGLGVEVRPIMFSAVAQS